MIRLMKKYKWKNEDTGKIILLPYKGEKGKKYKLHTELGVCLVSYQGD